MPGSPRFGDCGWPGRRPSSNAVVWVGAYNRSNAVMAGRQPLLVGGNLVEVVTTFTVFRVVFQVLLHFTAGSASLRDERLFSAGLYPIWPGQAQDVVWPKNRFVFSDEAFIEPQALARRTLRRFRPTDPDLLERATESNPSSQLGKRPGGVHCSGR